MRLQVEEAPKMCFGHFHFSRLAVALVLVAALTGAAFAQAPAAPSPLVKAYPLTIDGTATVVGKWACGGDARIDAKPAQTAEPVPGLSVGVQMVTVTASVPGIECGDATMDKHLRKALKVEQFPEIRYQADKYTLADNGTAVQTSGQLSIAGITKPVVLGAKLIPLPEGETRVVGNVAINMTEYGVKPPSMFWGILKVANVVTVRFDTTARLPKEVTEALFSSIKQPSAQ